jgi:hypothetical protein
MNPPTRRDITVLAPCAPQRRETARKRSPTARRAKDFDKFQPLFEQVERELKSGVRKALPFGRCQHRAGAISSFLAGSSPMWRRRANIKSSEGEPDARLRVIYGNGTESNLLMRSLQRRSTKTTTGGACLTRTWGRCLATERQNPTTSSPARSMCCAA